MDALQILCTLLLTPFSNFSLNAKLLESMFRYRGSSEGLKRRLTSSKKLDTYRSNFAPTDELGDDKLLLSIKNDF